MTANVEQNQVAESEMDDIVREFLVESAEGLEQVERDLVALEKTPGDRELLARVFRVVHTVKGTCGFLGFTRLEAVTHAGENLLSKLRDGALRLTPEIATHLLTLVDAIRVILAAIEESGAEPEDGDDAELIERLELLAQGETLGGMVPPVPAKPKRSGRSRKKTADGGAGGASQVAATQALQEEANANAMQAMVADSTIRVDVRLLDTLMDLVGELVLSRNQVLQLTQKANDAAMLPVVQRLNHITSELQEGVMKTRMQPIGGVWGKFPRIVRDLAIACGKLVRVEMEGKETELDRSLLEAIQAPLTHIVRNSVDHGIERPEVRVRNGKPAEGRLILRAFHEGGQVIIEIQDDGGGIDGARVRAKAIERGIVDEALAARMGERELIGLIFQPGFSTAEQVTNVSGRGVGMDVVKTNIERIGGTVDIQSELGRGTALRIKIPLTLAIIPALSISVSGERFTIPQGSLVELVRLDGDEAEHGIEYLHGAPVYRLRGQLLPLVYLAREFGLEALAPDGTRRVNIVVLQADDRRFGLVVDEINDTQEIVVKPLSQQLKGLETFAGATILGDGTVALILDVMGLAHRARVLSEVKERSTERQVATETQAAVVSRTLLVFRGADDGRMAIPLDAVTRLEVLSADAVERVGDQRVTQYRGDILPLVAVADVLPDRRSRSRAEGDGLAEPERELHVVVYRGADRQVGLVVGQILDIVETSGLLKPASRDGVQGTLVIQGRVTELLQLHRIVELSGLVDAATVGAGV